MANVQTTASVTDIDKITNLQSTANEIDSLIKGIDLGYKPKIDWSTQVSPNIITDSYIDNSGTVKLLAGYTVTDYIDVVENKKYINSLFPDSQSLFGGFYDANFTWLNSYNPKNATSISPTGAVYLRINVKSTYWEKTQILEEPTPTALKYKKIVFMGDSITAGHGLSDPSEHFVNLISDALSLNGVYNHGISGTHIASDGSSITNTGAERILNTEYDVEAIVIFMGVNDFLHTQTAPIGTSNDTTNTTFYGGLNVLFDTSIRKYIGKKILFVTPTPCVQQNTPNPTTGLILSEYVSIIKEVCNKYSIPILDLNLNFPVAPNIFSDAFFLDGLHPNKLGNKLLASLITKKLLQL